MRRKLLISLALFLSYGCLDEGEVADGDYCSFTSESYLYTTFDCFHYSIDHRICHRSDQEGCVDFAPELIMGHCDSRNICEPISVRE